MDNSFLNINKKLRISNIYSSLFFQIHITVLNTKLQCRLMVIHIDIYMSIWRSQIFYCIDLSIDDQFGSKWQSCHSYRMIDVGIAPLAVGPPDQTPQQIGQLQYAVSLNLPRYEPYSVLFAITALS